jgi:uncharacterized membrane protein
MKLIKRETATHFSASEWSEGTFLSSAIRHPLYTATFSFLTYLFLAKISMVEFKLIGHKNDFYLPCQVSNVTFVGLAWYVFASFAGWIV